MNQLSRSSLQAMIDVALDDEHGLEAITNIDHAKLVLEHLVPKIATPLAVLQRIRHSPRVTELVQHLPNIIGRSREKLDPYAREMLATVDQWDGGDVEIFADQYWMIRIRERICRGDFRRSWDEIRKAFQGLEPEPLEAFEPIKRGWIDTLAAPENTLDAAIDELYQAMANKVQFGPVRLEPVAIGDVLTLPGTVRAKSKHFPGGPLVTRSCHHGLISNIGQKAQQIALYLSRKRDEKRKSKVEKQLSR